jgi:hypothetical protein
MEKEKYPTKEELIEKEKKKEPRTMEEVVLLTIYREHPDISQEEAEGLLDELP